MTSERNSSLDALLDLDGVVAALSDDPAPYWANFVVKRVPVSPERPHGLYYSLTLHDPQSDHVLGFDNAHSVREGSGPRARTHTEYDHKHRQQSVQFYDYQDAGTLILDFWTEVESAINEKG
jgi:Family of unknown function (DUF6516)